MDESAHLNKPRVTPPTPEVDQLLKMIELQGAAHRERQVSGLQSPLFKYGSLAAIVVFGLGSVGLMEMFLGQMPKPAHNPVALQSPAPKSGTFSAIQQPNSHSTN